MVPVFTLLSSLALLHKSRKEAIFDLGRNGLRFHPFVDLDGPLRRVANDPAIRAFIDVPLEFGLRLRVERVVEVLAQLTQELLTGKQRRHLLFA